MPAERLYTLPESVDGDMSFDVGQEAENFEAHVAMLEKERACSAILGVFKRHPHLDALQFIVQDGTDDEVMLSNGRRLQVLDVTPIFDETSREEDTWEEACAITRDLAGTLTARNGDFFECLTLQRSQVLSPKDESRFPNLRAMRSWIEIDLK
jgi:hypothetical protein